MIQATTAGFRLFQWLLYHITLILDEIDKKNIQSLSDYAPKLNTKNLKLERGLG